jgi:hypothetical protein
MLAGEVSIALIEKDAFAAAGIIDHTGAEFASILAADDQRTNRVGTVIKTESEHGGEGGGS